MRIALLILLLAFSVNSYSQKNTTIPLLEYITSIEQKNKISFSYDAQLLQNVKVIPTKNLTLATTLSYLKKETAFNFKLLDNGTVLVSPYKENANIKLCINVLEAEYSIPLTGAIISTNSNDNTITITEDTLISYINHNSWSTINITLDGYKEQQFSIDEFNGFPCKTIYLSPSETVLDNVIINYLTSGIQYKNDDQSIEIKVKDAGLLPGETETDIFTTIEALPGINSTNGKSGSLVLRGDDPDKTLVHFDNIPIYHNGHYFGTFSPYNADLLKSVTVKRNGYDAKNGGGISGLIKMNTNNKIADSAKYSAGLATSYYLANANIPIIKDKWSIQFGTRSSYPFDLDTPKITAIEDFIFQQSIISQTEKEDNLALETFKFDFSDYNLKSNLKLNENNTINFSSLYVTNGLDLEVRRINESGGGNGGPPPLPANTFDNTYVNMENIGFNLEHQIKWNSNLATKSFITFSEFEQNFYNELAPPGDVLVSRSYKNIISNFSLKTITTKNFENKNILDFGIEATNYNVSGNRAIIAPNNLSFENVDTNGKLISLYSDFLLKKTTPLTVKIGLRGSYFSLKEKNIYVEPRLLMNYKINNQVTIKTSAGIYNQFLNHVSGRNGVGAGVEQFNWKLSNDSTIPVVHGRQVMLGTFYKKNKWLIDIEGYYKKTDNISIYDIYNYSNTNYFFVGNYKTVGADLLIRKSWNDLDAWVSYSHIKTLAQFGDIQENSFRSVWDQNHQLNVVFSYAYKKFKISTGWKYKSGLESLEDIRHFYLNGTPSNQPNALDYTYNDRDDTQYSEYPSQHQLDISLAYTYVPKGHNWNTVIGIAATNIYDQKNIFGQDRYRVSPSEYALSNRYGVGFAPSMLVKFNF